MDHQQTFGKRELGGGEIAPPIYHEGKTDEDISVADFISELCAYYMAIGMPREQFLYGERDAFDDYDKAYECARIMKNQYLHLQGVYNYRAFGSVLSSAFAGKGKKGVPYPDYPIPITASERKAEKERNIQKTLQWVRGRNRDAGRKREH